MRRIFFLSIACAFLQLTESYAQNWQYYDSLRIVYQEKESYDTALVYANLALDATKDKEAGDTVLIEIFSSIKELNYYTENYIKAIEFCEKEKDLRMKIQGKASQAYANACAWLGYLHYATGNYHLAEPLYVEAKSVRKEVLGEKHPDYALSLNNLALLYDAMGNYPAAEPLYIEAKELRKETMGEKSADYALALNNLAVMYDNMGNRKAAEPLLLEAMNVYKEILDENHSRYISSLNNLAVLYDEMENYQAAEPLYIKALELRKKNLGEKHNSYAISLNNLAYLYKATQRYDLAEPLYLEANNIWKEVFGTSHPAYATSLNNLALLYFARNDFKKASSYFSDCIGLKNNAIFRNFGFLSEKEKELYYNTQQGTFAGYYSFALKSKTVNPDITMDVFNNIIRHKGMLLRSSTAMRTAILGSNDTVLIGTYNSWIELCKEINKLNRTEISKRSKEPKELESQANDLEKELVRSSRVFGDFEKLQNLTWQDVQKGLKSGEAAIEFIHFVTGKKNDSTLYCALIVKPCSKYPEMIPLCEEKDLVALLNSAGKNVNLLYDKNSPIACDLFKLVWSPLENELKDIKTVYLSPSGWLHKISFSALVKDKETYLCDIYDIREQTGTSKIAMPESFSFDKNTSATIFGGIKYNTKSAKDETWPYLEGTLAEAGKICGLLNKNFKQVSVFTDTLGSEANFKQMAQQCNWLHVSTHGFFYPDLESGESEQNEDEENNVLFRGGSGYGLWQFVRSTNPLMRSGLVFAGANEVWNDKVITDREDGMLTAQEVAVLDMRKCDLVVLSACETGLGDIRGSEGVYGLQRAFKMAGVKYIIMSLWQVPDKETVEFMEMFYKKLLKKKNVRQAFNETQKEMRGKYDPYYWGAFVLIE